MIYIYDDDHISAFSSKSNTGLGQLITYNSVLIDLAIMALLCSGHLNFLEIGDHLCKTLAFSKWDLTSDLNNKQRSTASIYVNVLYIRPRYSDRFRDWVLCQHVLKIPACCRPEILRSRSQLHSSSVVVLPLAFVAYVIAGGFAPNLNIW